MFALFFNLYFAMFRGQWVAYDLNEITTNTRTTVSKLFEFLTSIFNNVSTPMTNMGDFLTMNNILQIVALILALITSIGIVVMAVKGVKKVFGIFFYGVK